MNKIHTPEAMLLISVKCPHCASVTKSLCEMVKQGELASLKIINLEKQPEVADELGVRSVPWIRIGWFEMEGLHSQKELQQRAQQASSDEGALAYISDELTEGRVNKVLSLLESQHEFMPYVLSLMEDADAKINIRLGIGVVLEEFAASGWFEPYIPQLVEYTRHKDERVRADACHYLSLTVNNQAITSIKGLLNDVSEEVREVAKESLDELRGAGLEV
ncbi:MAG: thioredoxin family protein [Gammaproteobacteria bacterium]|nr:thioredoxin family protein [Gammaproteobacteria bacterium]